MKKQANENFVWDLRRNAARASLLAPNNSHANYFAGAIDAL